MSCTFLFVSCLALLHAAEKHPSQTWVLCSSEQSVLWMSSSYSQLAPQVMHRGVRGKQVFPPRQTHSSPVRDPKTFHISQEALNTCWACTMKQPCHFETSVYFTIHYSHLFVLLSLFLLLKYFVISFCFSRKICSIFHPGLGCRDSEWYPHLGAGIDFSFHQAVVVMEVRICFQEKDQNL